MLSIEKKRQIQESLRTLAETHAIAVTQIENTISILIQTLELDEPFVAATEDIPFADTTTFCIRWHGKTCFLGNTLLFWLFHRLVQSVNGYVPHVDLLDDVWKGNRESSSIRGVAKRLRDRLTAAGMTELARAIDGTISGYYGLILV